MDNSEFRLFLYVGQIIWILKCCVRLAGLTNQATVLTEMSSYLPLNAIWAETWCLSQECSSVVSERSRKLSNKKLQYQSFVCANVTEEQDKAPWQQAFLSLLAWTSSWLCSFSSLSILTDGYGWGAVFCPMTVTERGLQTGSVVLLTNIQTLFICCHPLQVFTLCTFQWAEWDFPVFPTPEAVADLWPKFIWRSRTTNCAEACWLKTLLKTCSCRQMWVTHVSEKLHAVGRHSLLILAVPSETQVPPPLAHQLAVAGSLFPLYCWWRELGKGLPLKEHKDSNQLPQDSSLLDFVAHLQWLFTPEHTAWEPGHVSL